MEHQSLKTLKGLVLEDNVINQKIIAYTLLRKWDISFDVASNGEIALEMLSGNLYDFVIMDDRMPVMDGIAKAADLLMKRMVWKVKSFDAFQ